ncbi:MAG: radical SAM protein [Actinobacteria bacterium]|nr:radical SAM protein [Actinomycetota bacterium]
MSPDTVIAYPANGNLYLNITNRCSCACTFCLRGFTSEVYGYELLLEREPAVEEIIEAAETSLDREPAAQIVFCGLGEPTLRLDAVLEVIRWARVRGLPTRLDTNGLGATLHPSRDVAAELVEAGLDAVSISLNAADPDVYEALCRPLVRDAHAAVVEFARRCAAAGLDTTLSALDGVGVDLEACARLAADIGGRFRVRGCALPPGWEPVLGPDGRPHVAGTESEER